MEERRETNEEESLYTWKTIQTPYFLFSRPFYIICFLGSSQNIKKEKENENTCNLPLRRRFDVCA